MIADLRKRRPDSFVTRTPGAHRSGRFRYGLGRFVENAGEAADDHLCGAGTLERGHAGTAGRATGKDIVDQQDVCTAKRIPAPGRHGDRAGQTGQASRKGHTRTRLRERPSRSVLLADREGKHAGDRRPAASAVPTAAANADAFNRAIQEVIRRHFLARKLKTPAVDVGPVA